MSHYRTKPETIEAIQWNGDNLTEIETFIGRPAGQTCKSISGLYSGEILFDTDMGVMMAVTGCWICKTAENKIFVMTNSEFLAEYEPVD